MKKYFGYLVIITKAVTAYALLHTVYRFLLKKDIWLFEEKQTEARDNAYYLYKYVKYRRFPVNAYYVIRKGSPDAEKIKQYGITINAGSIKHYMYWMAAKYSINSQQYGAAPYPTSAHHKIRFLCRNDQRVVFLQHGIIKDDMVDLHYDKTKFDLFVCSAAREYEQVKNTFGYPEDKVKLLGLCRFDGLKRSSQRFKQIIIMPTYREWMRPAKTYADATEEEIESFKRSLFYTKYSQLLANEQLKRMIIEYDYKVLFYLHYSFQPYISCFKDYESPSIIIADRSKYDVQQLLLDGEILVTDFSSVAFDFAYMEKPVLYYQFDEEEYRSKHYRNGYYDYHVDGFGPVFNNEDKVVEYLEYILDSDCIMEQKYVNQVNQFFTIRDAHNCQRNYNAILDLA